MGEREQVSSVVWAVAAVVIAIAVAAIFGDAVGAENTLPILGSVFGGLTAIAALFVGVLKAFGVGEIRAGVRQANHELNGELKPRLIAAAAEANAPLEAEIRELKARLSAGDAAFGEIRAHLEAINARLDLIAVRELSGPHATAARRAPQEPN